MVTTFDAVLGRCVNTQSAAMPDGHCVTHDRDLLTSAIRRFELLVHLPVHALVHPVLFAPPQTPTQYCLQGGREYGAGHIECRQLRSVDGECPRRRNAIDNHRTSRRSEGSSASRGRRNDHDVLVMCLRRPRSIAPDLIRRRRSRFRGALHARTGAPTLRRPSPFPPQVARKQSQPGRAPCVDRSEPRA